MILDKKRCLIPILFIALITWNAATASAAEENLARQVLSEMNLARTSPARYFNFVNELRRHFKGKELHVPGAPIILTKEGTRAVDGALAYLGRQKPLAELEWSEGLSDAAADLVRDEGSTGEVGHNGSRSGGMRERIEEHGRWSGRIAENIGYGPDTARQMVMQLIIDDAVPDRGHRRNIFDPRLKVAGVACGTHPKYRVMCVIDFATRFKE